MILIPTDTNFFVGDVVYEKGGRYGPSRQTHLQLVWLERGHASVEAEDKRYTCNTGEAFLMLPGRTYQILFSDDVPARHGWVDARTYLPPAGIRARLEALPDTFALSERLRRLAAMARSIPQPHGRAARRLYEDLARAAFSEGFYLAGLEDETERGLPEPLQRAQRFVEDRYNDPLDLEAIARAAGVSKAHLIRLSKKHLGTTPMQQLWNVRLREGCRLLRQTGLSIAEVAYRVGFQTPYHFSRHVRQHAGMPPRAYRQSHWEQPGAKPSNDMSG